MFTLLIEDVLNKDECELLIQRGLQTDLQVMYSSKIVNGKILDDNILKLDDNKRRGSYFFEDEMKENMFVNLTHTLISLVNSIKIFNGIEYISIPKYTFNQYGEGDFLNWHPDTHEIMNGATATIIIQLNDNYEGGEVMYRLSDIEYNVPKKAGSIFIFDSNIEHNVNIVESGIRYSMNAWPSSKIKKGLL
jgi:Rps23 Pro-64 3,4-dihydroxylase Tpa1-like proline 4-hydroxylase